MKKLISAYTFDASTKKLTLTDYPASLANLLLVTNVTSNVVIYRFNTPALGATISGNDYVLNYDTTGMSNSDKLQIWYDDGSNKLTSYLDAALTPDGNTAFLPSGIMIAGYDEANTGAMRLIRVDASGSVQITAPNAIGVEATIADGSDATLGAKADAKSTATDTTPITIMQVLKQISASVQAPPSQAVTNAGTFAVQAATTIADGADVTLGAKADAKSTATDTTPITIMQVLKQISASVQAPPSQAVTNAGTFAVQAATTIADGADVTLGAKTDAKSTATDGTSVSAMQVLKQISASVQAPPSQAVTNAGTFAVQESGSALTSLQLIDDTVATAGSAITTKGQAVAGTDGTNARILATTTGGILKIDLSGTAANATAVKVDGSAVTQPVSGTVTANAGTGTFAVSGTVTANLAAGSNAIGKLAANDGIDIGDVTINNAGGASAVNIQDGGNSLTVDYATTGSGTATGALRVELPTNGTGVIATVGAVTAITNALPAGTNAIGKLAANDSIDIGDVTINNASGGSAVNIQDGGNSITVDNGGTFAVQDSQVLADNAGFTDGTSKVFTAGFIYDEVAGTALTENDVAAARVTANRAVVAAIEDGATRARYATVTASNALKVDGSAVTQPVSGTVTVQQSTATSLKAQAEAYQGGTAVGAANPLQVTLANGSVPSHAVTNAGTFAVQVDGAALTSLQLIDDTVVAQSTALGSTKNSLIGGSVTTSAPSYTTGNINPLSLTTGGALRVDASAANITVNSHAVTNAGTFAVQPAPATSGGLLIKNCTSGDGSTALTNSAQAISSGAGQLYGWYIFNPNTSTAYIPIYNVASGSVTVGTTNPAMVLAIPAGAAANLEMTHGIAFSTAISAAAATTAGGNTAPSTPLEANFFYKG